MAYNLTIPPGADLNKFKPDIIKLAEEYLVDNSLIDLTGFIHNDLNIPEPNGNSAFIRDIANRMKRTGHYDIIEQENGQRFLVYPLPKKPFKERFWFPIAVFAYFIGLLTPTFQEWIKQKSLPEKSTKDTTQVTSVQSFQDTAHQRQGTLQNQKTLLSQPKIDTVKK